MELKGWTSTELAGKLGVSTAMVYIYFNKKDMPNTKKFQKLLKSEVDIDAEWLIEGKEKTYENDLKVVNANENQINFSKELDLYNYLNMVEEVKRLRDRVSVLETQLYNLQNNKK